MLLALSALAYGTVPLVERLTLQWFVRDLDLRSSLIAKTLQSPLAELIKGGSRGRTASYIGAITEDERLHAIGVCDGERRTIAVTRSYPAEIACGDPLERFIASGTPLLSSARGPLHVAVAPIELAQGEGRTGAAAEPRIVIVHDMSFVQRRSEETKRYLFYFFVALGVIVSLITVVVAQISWRGWVNGIRGLLKGGALLRPLDRIGAPELRPFAQDLRGLIRDLESEYRPRDDSHLAWSPDALKQILRKNLRGDDILVVSNREPYMHSHGRDGVEMHRPASGLVTALEPVMRACSGTWIAHGSGSADRDFVDRSDRLQVPPEKPAYQLRRVWLSSQEEAGYYYGFSNEGLWPLCHMAHVRPIFRTADWRHYVEVNRTFARAVIQETKSSNPVVLVQDYHFALLPRMIRDQLPDATIITFWHIPWPNPETFAICPWRDELLEGLLGSSILGFHTQFHCNNFLDTVDRQLEARVDRELFSVSFGGKPTAVKRYPISIEWPPTDSASWRAVSAVHKEIRDRYGLPSTHRLGVGVDRLDYTKGILERFRAIERLFETEPQWIGRFTFVQLAAPSRSSIEHYRLFEEEVRATATRINHRYGRSGFPPIILRVAHHDADEVYEHYRAADLCCVSSLHDGMNLVAKEFVAARDDEQGVLVLSQFTGASRELPEALIVNPYDVDQSAAALHSALAMPELEQRDRMRIMRGLVREFNVYRWAGRMLLDAAIMRRHDRVRDQASSNVLTMRRRPR